MSKTKKTGPSKSPARWWVLGIGIIALAAVIGLVAWRLLKPAAEAYPLEINVTQAAEKRTAGAFILDVRQPEEWEQFHIPEATLIPLGELSARLNEIPKDREIVVVCRTGRRSAQGRDTLRQAGYAKVTSLAGGVTAWQAAGLPIATGK